ncbi:MAG: hypothetical protein H7645_08945 [Candidatus Heimdallarchaeota archaeon]|nr:hypothetical protein [Candidatus Heimdallarchaeota archaeon]MCK4770452.1 hypothetical protein [Candidatus Heimdallarchaeota archaeon]
MSSKELELIEQIKLAEQQAEKTIQDSKTEASKLLEKAQNDRIRRLENAKHEAREILKTKIEEARTSHDYDILVEEAEGECAKIREKTKDKIPEVSKKVASFILEIGKEG